MTRDDMVQVLIPALVNAGMGMTAAKRRLWGMGTRALQRELLLRGLTEYEDPPQVDEDEVDADMGCGKYLALQGACTPVYED